MADDLLSKAVPLLMKMALFRILKQSQVEQIAQDFEVISLNAGQRLFSQGEPGETFFVVFSGKLRITSGLPGEPEQTLGVVGPGDYLGEGSMLYGRPRSASATAIEPTIVLQMVRQKFYDLFQKYPGLLPYLMAVVESRRLARQLHFSWLGPDETIYLLLRRHRVYLVVQLIAPVLVGWLSIPFLYVGVVAGEVYIRVSAAVLGLIILLIAALWGIWRWIDWGNDYYIVTDQRVLALQKVVGLYESIQEAPLATVLSVGTQTESLGRFLKYGTVMISTFIGRIAMEQVENPTVLAALVEEQVARGKSAAQRAETAAFDQYIRQRIGMGAPPPPPKPAPPPAAPAPLSLGRAFANWLHRLFVMRYEVAGSVIFRKHWIFLLAEAWKPTLGILAAFFVLFTGLAGWIPVFVALLVWFLAMAGFSFWWWYEYTDWRNDIYQINDDQIIDIEKKPFGKEEKRVAQLENVASIRHERKGMSAVLLNFGDVVATVGAEKFTFDAVYNPSGVEHEIFHRIIQRKRKQRDAELIRQREYIGDWLAAYHRVAQNPPQKGQNPG